MCKELQITNIYPKLKMKMTEIKQYPPPVERRYNKTYNQKELDLLLSTSVKLTIPTDVNYQQINHVHLQEKCKLSDQNCDEISFKKNRYEFSLASSKYGSTFIC
jgi:hypothetical protein